MSDHYPPVTLPRTEVRMLRSHYSGREYKLFISLPEGYEQSEDSYPVLYVTDANWFFRLFGLLEWTLPIPPTIVVGVGYSTDNRTEIRRLRRRDLLPKQTREDESVATEGYGTAIDSGGLPEFMSFFHEELFPFVESQYRAKADERTYFGYSWGGTFGIVSLFERPDAFKRYIIGAPDLRWDDELLFDLEREFAQSASDLPVKLHLSVGAADEDLFERNASMLFRIHAALDSRNYESLDLRFEVFAGETHYTSPTLTALHGLRAVFN